MRDSPCLFVFDVLAEHEGKTEITAGASMIVLVKLKRRPLRPVATSKNRSIIAHPVCCPDFPGVIRCPSIISDLNCMPI